MPFSGYFSIIPSSSTLLNIDCKIPQVLEEPHVFFWKKPEETTISRTAFADAETRPSQAVGQG